MFDKLKSNLKKTRDSLTKKIDSVITLNKKVDNEFYEELEEILITSDVSFSTTVDIINKLKENINQNKEINSPNEIKENLKTIITNLLEERREPLTKDYPLLIKIVGVNGVGKTTTIGKLAYKYKNEGKSVLVAAGDTFRAAAVEQLEIWCNKAGVNIIKNKEGTDPGAVIYDAINSARKRNIDVLICDTAGRIHTKNNLMKELKKIKKIIDNEYKMAKKETLLVLDATTGQNAISQANLFNEATELTGLILTKLDGTAKGGIALTITEELGLPIKLIGTGESIEDLIIFNPKDFTNAIF